MAWALLTRNQAEVEQRVRERDYDQVLGTGWSGLDDFLVLLQELGVLSLVETMGEGYQRRMIPAVLLLTTYSLKVLAGLSSMNQVPELLFRDIGLLQRIGFTVQQLEQGLEPARQGPCAPRP